MASSSSNRAPSDPVLSHPTLSYYQSTRLKYARPQDLPSYPSMGLKADGAAASAAASLGWASSAKAIEHHENSSSSPIALAAAVQARDHDFLAQAIVPESDLPGQPMSKLATESARASSGSLKASASAWGSSAASLAFEAARTSPKAPQRDEARSLTRKNSLNAARASVSANARRRSASSPQAVEDTYPDQANAATNALSAATFASHRQTLVPVEEAGAVPFTTMNRNMFTSRPPVQPEVEEQQRADVLHASAVAMAKGMFDRQQKMIEASKQTETLRSSSFNRRRAASSPQPSRDDDSTIIGQPLNLQEAAYRLAQERLAKLRDEHQGHLQLQEYYGSAPLPSQRKGKLGTIRRKLTRRRSDSDSVLEDRKRSIAIRRQMSTLNAGLSKVDEQKRTKDREALLAAAHRNVRARLERMDQKVYEETGRIAPRKLTEWELKAHAAAQARSDNRQSHTQGMIDLGGGRFMAQEEVDEIAARRLKPLLDDIEAKAEEERERQLAERLDEERRKEEAEREKAREKEIQDIYRKLKDQNKEAEKARKAQAKQEAKARKEEEKNAQAEQKRQAQDEKKASKDGAQPGALHLREGSSGDDGDEAGENPPTEAPLDNDQAENREGTTRNMVRVLIGRNRRSSSPPLDDESTSPTAKVRNWFKSRFSRPRAKSSASTSDEATAERKEFVGGVRLRRERDGSSESVTGPNEGSVRDVALASAPDSGESEPSDANAMNVHSAAVDRRTVSSSDSSSSGQEFVEAPDDRPGRDFVIHRTLAERITGRGSGSVTRESRFSEIIE
ncbi:hypothetical protein VTK73DRAFT_6059 [Phialemonium thermophilum]|uniref:Eisosome protein 1 n=1 Tax=Phialemonium thermophilum TaxID=223376 RepID=A0ABR3XW48_9PEZI